MRTLLILLLSIGCSQAEPLVEAPAPQAPVVEQAPVVDQAQEAPAASDDAASAGDRTLLFFLNPNGRPCQMQQAIITQLGDSLTVPVREVSVLDNSNRPALYQYGIRSLPAMILVDAAGQELHRFTPGIQQGDTILAALD